MKLSHRSVLFLFFVLALVYDVGEVFAGEPERRESDGVHLFVTFSGGGIRAAAFGFGVAQALLETDAGGVPCIGRVDEVAGVSGGSFIATQLAIDPSSEGLSAFRDRVLLADHEAALMKRALENGLELLSRKADRSDVAARYYSTLFGDHTLGRPGPGPRLRIQATDLRTGRPFLFLPDTLAHMHLAPEDVPVGTAIAASAAFPGAFPPLTMEFGGHHPDECPGGAACKRAGERDEAAEVQLADGGILDNLGLQAFLEGQAPKGCRGIVLVVVNARRTSEPPSRLRGSTVRSSAWVVSLQQRRLDELLLERARDRLRCLEHEARLAGSSLRTHLLLIDFEASDRKDEMNAVGTRLSLPPEDVEILAAEGRKLAQRRLPEIADIWGE